MKLTQDQINEIKSFWGDWENVHCKYDDLMENRLRELDPEYMDSLNEATKGATFWFA